MLTHVNRVVVPLILLTALGTRAEESIERQFSEPPPNATRAGVAFTIAEDQPLWVERQLERIHNLGAGGVLLRLALPDATQRWEVCAATVARAQQLRLDVGVHFFDPFEVNIAATLQAHHLMWTATVYRAESCATNSVAPLPVLPTLPGSNSWQVLLALPQEVPVVTLPQVSECHADNLPINGTWQLWRFGSTPLAPPLLDPFNGRALARTINRWLTQAQQRMRPTYGVTLLWLQIDAPSRYVSLWSDQLPQLFLKQSGLPLTRNLPILAGCAIGGRANSEYVAQQVESARQRLWREGMGLAAKELIQEAGLDAVVSIGEALVDPVEVAYYVRRPLLHSSTNMLDAANIMAAGGARVFARRHIMGLLDPVRAHDAESSAILRVPWKAAADRLFIEGVTRIILDYPTGLPSDDSHFRQLRDGCTYLHRCQTVLQQGMPAGDLLVWAREPLAPLRGYSCDYTNAQNLKEPTFRGGRIVFPSGREYTLLAVDERVAQHPPNLQLLRQISGHGIKVVLVRHTAEVSPLDVEAPPPEPSDFPTITTAQDAARYHKPDFEWQADTPDVALHFVHRRFTEHEVYFVANTGINPGSVTCTFRDVGKGRPMRWDAESGTIEALSEFHATFDRRTSATLFMEPYGSCFVAFEL